MFGDFKNENALMNSSITNQVQNQNMLFLSYQNQINHRYKMNQMNIPINQYQNYQKMKFNNMQNNYLMNKKFLYTQNMIEYPKLYPNYFSRNDNFIQNNYYNHKDKKYKNKNKKRVFNRNQNNEELSKINDEKFFYEKLKREQKDNYLVNSIDNKFSTYSENKINEINNNIENNKETSNIKNNKTEKNEKKEDEDFYEINPENIKTTRRFSQRSKRSSDSDNSNYSKSTALTKNDSEKDTTQHEVNDVSNNENENLTKKEEKTEHKGNPVFENTEILNVQVKISENNTAIFKLKRYDDIFMTIQYFCEINNLKEEMIKPLIIKSLCAINTIYQVMNSKIDQNNLELLKEVQNEL